MVALCKHHPPWHRQRLLIADRQLALRGAAPLPPGRGELPDTWDTTWLSRCGKRQGTKVPFTFGGRCWGGGWVGEVIPLVLPWSRHFWRQRLLSDTNTVWNQTQQASEEVDQILTGRSLLSNAQWLGPKCLWASELPSEERETNDDAALLSSHSFIHPLRRLPCVRGCQGLGTGW